MYLQVELVGYTNVCGLARLVISGKAVRRHDTGQRTGFQGRHDKIVSIVTRSVYRGEELAASHGPRINRDTGQPGQGLDASGRRNTQSASHFFNRPPHRVLKGLGFTGLGSPLDQRPVRIKSTFTAARLQW